MRSVFRTSAAVSAAALLTGATLALGAAPASAATDRQAPKVLDAALSTNLAVIKVKGHDVIRVTAHVTDNVGVTQVWVPLYRAGKLMEYDGQPVAFPMRRISGTAKDGIWVSRFWPTAGEQASQITVGVHAVDARGNWTEPEYAGRFRAKYDTRVVDFRASSKSVEKGLPVTLSGRFQYVGDKGWQGLTGEALIVQFRPLGTTTWTRVGRVFATPDGAFSLAVTPQQSGSYRVVYAGDFKQVATTSVARKVVVG